MAASDVRDGRLNLSHSIEVVATGGRPVLVLSFSEAISVRWTEDR